MRNFCFCSFPCAKASSSYAARSSVAQFLWGYPPSAFTIWVPLFTVQHRPRLQYYEQNSYSSRTSHAKTELDFVSGKGEMPRNVVDPRDKSKAKAHGTTIMLFMVGLASKPSVYGAVLELILLLAIPTRTYVDGFPHLAGVPPIIRCLAFERPRA